MKTSKKVLGIDFGTSNSYMCEGNYSNSQVKPFQFTNGFDGLQTAVLQRSGKKPLIGDAAIEEWTQSHIENSDVLNLKMSFKPEIHIDKDAREAAAIFFRGMLDVQRELARIIVKPEECEVLIGVPAKTPDSYRKALQAIAEEAGFGSIQTVLEPVGALVTSLISEEHDLLDHVLASEGILVVDFGGGTCDFAFLGGGENVKASWGHFGFGGRQFDDLFFQWFVEYNQDAVEEYRVQDPGGLAYFLLDECRRAKERFSTRMTHNRQDVYTWSFHSPRGRVELSWDEFRKRAGNYVPSKDLSAILKNGESDAPIEGILESCVPVDLINTFENLVSEATPHIRDVEKVLLTGGSSLWPFVRESVERVLSIEGKGVVVQTSRPNACIAEGITRLPFLRRKAAMTARKIEGDLPNFMEYRMSTLIGNEVDELAAQVAKDVALFVEQQVLRPALAQWEGQGGTVKGLEDAIRTRMESFPAEMSQKRDSLVKDWASGLIGKVEYECGEWFRDHDVYYSAQKLRLRPSLKGAEIDGTSCAQFSSAVENLLATAVGGLVIALVALPTIFFDQTTISAAAISLVLTKTGGKYVVRGIPLHRKIVSGLLWWKGDKFIQLKIDEIRDMVQKEYTDRANEELEKQGFLGQIRGEVVRVVSDIKQMAEIGSS